MADTRRAEVRGHFGELRQGRVGPQGQVALITLPCPVLGCTVLHGAGAPGLCFLANHSPSPSAFTPVLSIRRCSAPVLGR